MKKAQSCGLFRTSYLAQYNNIFFYQRFHYYVFTGTCVTVQSPSFVFVPLESGIWRKCAATIDYVSMRRRASLHMHLITMLDGHVLHPRILPYNVRKHLFRLLSEIIEHRSSLLRLDIVHYDVSLVSFLSSVYAHVASLEFSF